MILEYDLQFFAKDGPGGEKTEQPTSKKIEDARKEGQVAKSQELGNAVSLIALFLILKIAGTSMGENFVSIFQMVYDAIPNFTKMVSGEIPKRDYAQIMSTVMLRMVIMLLPVFIIGVVSGVAVNILQVRWHPTTKPLQPKFDKLNPANGFKRLFSKEKLMDLLKAIIKIVLIFYVVWSYMKGKAGMLLLLYDYPMTEAVALVSSTVIDLGLRVSFIYLIFGLADFGYQKWKFRQDMMMTKQEVKDEWKNSEGDPQVKQKIRQKMMEVSRSRMMQEVPKADVVITNPTHYAVALKYDTERAAAPIVVAKGQDFLAQKIKEAARENDVEIVENKPLARMLYHNVEIGAVIPPELYQSVAEVLAFVYNLRKKNGTDQR